MVDLLTDRVGVVVFFLGVFFVGHFLVFGGVLSVLFLFLLVFLCFGVVCLFGFGVVLLFVVLFLVFVLFVLCNVPARERLKISAECTLILPYHDALEHARETARGKAALGTTGRGIGPAYDDKVARRALRLGDLFHRERFAAKLGEGLDYHNFGLQLFY